MSAKFNFGRFNRIKFNSSSKLIAVESAIALSLGSNQIIVGTKAITTASTQSIGESQAITSHKHSNGIPLVTNGIVQLITVNRQSSCEITISHGVSLQVSINELAKSVSINIIEGVTNELQGTKSARAPPTDILLGTKQDLLSTTNKTQVASITCGTGQTVITSKHSHSSLEISEKVILIVALQVYITGQVNISNGFTQTLSGVKYSGSQFISSSSIDLEITTEKLGSSKLVLDSLPIELLVSTNKEGFGNTTFPVCADLVVNGYKKVTDVINISDSGLIEWSGNKGITAELQELSLTGTIDVSHKFYLNIILDTSLGTGQTLTGIKQSITSVDVESRIVNILETYSSKITDINLTAGVITLLAYKVRVGVSPRIFIPTKLEVNDFRTILIINDFKTTLQISETGTFPKFNDPNM